MNFIQLFLIDQNVLSKRHAVWKVHIDRRQACRSFVEIRRVRFDHRKKRVRNFQRFGESVLSTAKGVGGLQKFVGSALTTVMCVGGLQRLGESVLTTAMGPGGLQMLGESVLTTGKHVGGLQSFGKCILTIAMRVGGLHRLGVSFDYRNACRRLAEVRRARFDHRKAWRTLAEIETVLNTAKRIGGLHKFVGSALTTEKRVRNFKSSESTFWAPQWVQEACRCWKSPS